MDAAQFRTDFPEFADTTAYPDGQVNLWLGLGAKLLPVDVWLDLTDLGLELFAAHNLILGRQDQAKAARGGQPGQASGVLVAKAVGNVSASYDTGVVTLADAGAWNLTTYGTRFLQFARLVGMGPAQL